MIFNLYEVGFQDMHFHMLEMFFSLQVLVILVIPIVP